MDEKTLFEKLNAINVNDHTETRTNGSKDLTYLSWTWAISEFTKAVGEWDYDILPYTYDENLGYMVYTTITVNNKTKKMWLPVMDGANKAMKAQPYKYYVKNWKDPQKPLEKTCEAATMFDVNKAYMRCLVKNMSVFGLGLYIFAGEDIPEVEEETSNNRKSDVFDGLDEKTMSISELFDKYYSESERAKIYEHYGIFDSSQMQEEILVKYINDRRKNV
ncbi:MAG: DUF1071 domain-containing protein [Bacteroidales bacterium]|nr:DUF1071 domain-containing protein [Candidatus Scybalousia scybalohippi]